MAPARKIRPPSSRYSKRQSTDHSPSTVATGTAVHRPSATTRQSIPPTTVTEPPKTQQQNAYFRTKPIPCTSSSTRNDENNNSNSNSRHNSRKRPFFDETSKDTDSSLATSDVQSSSSTPPKFDSSQVIHDPEHYMFKIRLGSNGNIAALCYLPTKFATLVEFYHTEVPLKWRHLGIGDLLVQRAFEWVEQSNLLVIPSCPFVLRYIETYYPEKNNGYSKYIVDDSEQSGLTTLARRK